MRTETITLGHTRGSGLAVPAPILAIASDWHGGQSSMLYALASTGGLTLGRDRADLVDGLDTLGGLWWTLAGELSGPVDAGELASVWVLYCRDVSAALEDAADQLDRVNKLNHHEPIRFGQEQRTPEESATLDHVESHVSALTACAYAATVVDALAGSSTGEGDPWAHADWVGSLYGLAGSELVISDPWSVLLNPLSLESQDGEHVSIVITSGGPHHELRWPFAKPGEAVWKSVIPLFHVIESDAGYLLARLAERVDAALPGILDPEDTMADDTPREIMLTLFTAGTHLTEGELP